MQNFMLKNSAGAPQREPAYLSQSPGVSHKKTLFIRILWLSLMNCQVPPGFEFCIVFSWSNLWLAPGWYWELRGTGISEINSTAVSLKSRGNTERAEHAGERASRLDTWSKLGRHSSSSTNWQWAKGRLAVLMTASQMLVGHPSVGSFSWFNVQVNDFILCVLPHLRCYSVHFGETIYKARSSLMRVKVLQSCLSSEMYEILWSGKKRDFFSLSKIKRGDTEHSCHSWLNKHGWGFTPRVHASGSLRTNLSGVGREKKDCSVWPPTRIREHRQI